MAELGNVIGALMSSLLRARYIADEQTAALAEQYKDNPLLEGLSVPRIRIPELTIDMPILIDNYQDEEQGIMTGPQEIANQALSQLKSSLSKLNKDIPQSFYDLFLKEANKRLEMVCHKKTAITKETAIRSVQDSLFEALTKSNISLTIPEKENVIRELRVKVAATSLSKAPVSPKIVTNIRTADVKERSSSQSAVRLKVTFKEEGLEWATQVSESGGVVRTLQPE